MDLVIDHRLIDDCRSLAKPITNQVFEFIEIHSTVAIERATLRLLGLNGASKDDLQIPYTNICITKIKIRWNILQNIFNIFNTFQ